MIVGLCSSYKEGSLVKGAIRSLLAACDRVVVFEGPAGEPLDADIPDSDFGTVRSDASGSQTYDDLLQAADELGIQLDFTIRHGRWSTDAKKRTGMLESLRPFTGPTWGVWIDGDEVLMNPEYLRDWLGYWDQVEETTGEQGLGWPIKLVEMDGSIHVVQAKVLRVDRLDSYSVSSSVFKTTLGQLHGRGNYPLRVGDSPLAGQLRQLATPNATVFAWPPMPGEPFILHRSRLRHPLRQGLRMSDQEKVEIAKAQAAGLA